MKNAVEFQARIDQGMIKIPTEYQEQLVDENELYVVIVKPLSTISLTNKKGKDIIDHLTENPIPVNGFMSREEIYER